MDGPTYGLRNHRHLRGYAVVKIAIKTATGHHRIEDNIVGIDAKDGWVATDGWAEVSSVQAVDLAKQFKADGISAIVYTDIARDGMMQGVNVEATAQLARDGGIPVIASGGVTNIDDIKRLKTVASSGIIGAITGRAIYEGTINVAEAQALADAP